MFENHETCFSCSELSKNDINHTLVDTRFPAVCMFSSVRFLTGSLESRRFLRHLIHSHLARLFSEARAYLPVGKIIFVVAGKGKIKPLCCKTSAGHDNALMIYYREARISMFTYRLTNLYGFPCRLLCGRPRNIYSQEKRFIHFFPLTFLWPNYNRFSNS